MSNKKIKLTKEQQVKIINFFLKTSVPRMLKEKSNQEEIIYNGKK